MPRTERQIAEYMAYYAKAPKEERKWALENLSSVEKKSKDEILAICGKYNGNVELRKVAVPEDLTERIKAKAREGMSTSDIVKNYGLSASTVNRIKQEMRENGEDIPKGIGGRRTTEKYKRLHPEEQSPEEQQPEEVELNEQQAEQLVDALESSKAEHRHPEAYPGQIYDDSPEPVVEPADPVVDNDVKIFIPGKQTGTFDAAANSPIDVEKAVNENCEKIREKAQESDNERIIEVRAKNEALREEIKRQRENALKIWNALSEPPVPGNPIPFTHSCGDQPCKKQCSGIWFALRDSLSEYLLGTFGAGTELNGESVEPDTERLVIRFKTADGKAMRCTLRAEGKHGK